MVHWLDGGVIARNFPGMLALWSGPKCALKGRYEGGMRPTPTKVTAR